MTAPAPLSAQVKVLSYRTLIADLEKEIKGLDEPLNISHRLPGSGTYESPLDGAALGRITRERVKPVWLVTAREQLVEHFTREFPGVLETVFLLEVPGIDEPVALPEDHPITVALAQSAPELLTPVQRVPDEVIADALAQSAETGHPAAPGIQLVRRSQGKLSVVFDKIEAPGAVRRLLREGLVTLPWDEQPTVELDGLAS